MTPSHTLTFKSNNSPETKFKHLLDSIHTGFTLDLTNQKFTAAEWQLLLDNLKNHQKLVYINLTSTGLSDAHVELLLAVMMKQKSFLKTLILCHNQLSAAAITKLDNTSKQNKLSVQIDYFGNPGLKPNNALAAKHGG